MELPENATWDEGVEAPHYDALDVDIDADVVVIGGGITGILTAYLLAKEGKRVVLVEKDELCQKATGATTAFVTQLIDSSLSKLSDLYGAQAAPLILRSHQEGGELIERIVKDEGIDCEFMRVPNLLCAVSDEEVAELSEELGAGTAFDLPMAQGTEPLPMNVVKYLIHRNQAKFHPLKFCFGLARAAERHGVRIFEHSEVKELIDGKALTKNGSVRAPRVIGATYRPMGEPLGLYFKKGMYISYVYEFRTSETLPELIGQDLANPYHYFRFDRIKGGTRIIVGGEDHRVDIPMDKEKAFGALMEWCREVFSGKFEFEQVRRWQGWVLESGDGLAYLGQRGDDPFFYASGFSGNGMTYSAIAAKLASDWLAGRQNQYAKLYAAGRSTELGTYLQKAVDYLKEFKGGAVDGTVHPPENLI
jgi:glycine/D-amino acid oxidase-like deaminating enzyme